ncbi:hypothetical protein JTF06_02760 [Desemzia sp. RIT804]|uniref:hypothetical protein n=1 Tax=Desemzia sp. RIT 804 TaxID=2810209 RepID=UPI00194E286A|nr:hypothetical protein [Desemzia sp. RIT 804]MBM6613814.1 hypothetical protein [Desemzia sp. RIT 804]
MKSTKRYVSLRIAVVVAVFILVVLYFMNKISFGTWQVLVYLLLAGNFALIALRYRDSSVQGAKLAVGFNSLLSLFLLGFAFYWAVFVL